MCSLFSNSIRCNPVKVTCFLEATITWMKHHSSKNSKFNRLWHFPHLLYPFTVKPFRQLTGCFLTQFQNISMHYYLAKLSILIKLDKYFVFWNLCLCETCQYHYKMLVNLLQVWKMVFWMICKTLESIGNDLFNLRLILSIGERKSLYENPQWYRIWSFLEEWC